MSATAEQAAEPDGYLSETYYAVVVTGQRAYRGWKCTWSGLGTMMFGHARRGLGFRVEEKRGRPDHWMEDCWNEARRIINEHPSSDPASGPRREP